MPDIDAKNDEYNPCVVLFDEPPRAEFVMRDCATIYRDTAHPAVQEILDMETREVIGMCVDLPGARDERAEERGWMPIETAPKDGTEIIGKDARGRIIKTWFHAPWENEWKTDALGIWSPILWIPLPPAAIRAGGTDG